VTAVNFDAIPAELRSERRWVVAREELRDGRPTKVPYCASDPARRASSTDEGTWSDFETARRLVEGGTFPWIGFMFHGSGYTGIDLDWKEDEKIEKGTIPDWATELILGLDSYTELSVSEKGAHVIAKGNLPPGGHRTGKTGTHPPVPAGSEVEMYDAGRYFVLTGHVLLSRPRIQERSEQIAALHARLFGAPQAEASEPVDGPAPAAALSDDTLLGKIRASKQGEKFTRLFDEGDTSAYKGDDSEADFALCVMLGWWTQKDHDRIERLFNRSKLGQRDKWTERADYRQKTIEKACKKLKAVYQPRVLTVEDFVAYMPTHAYYCVPTREFWSERSVDQRVPSPKEGQSTTEWLDFNRHVEQMTWWPGRPLVIENAILADGGLIDRAGFRIFNQYRPPVPLVGGEPTQVGIWLEHLRRIYPSDWNHAVGWFAHRIQRPHEKLNHALVLGGEPGIGKDTLLDPVRVGVGEWNTQEIAPADIMKRFNGYVKSVLLRISEGRDLGDVNRYAFYEHTKTLIAAPPEVLRVDEKHLREYPVPNLTGVLITTNHKTDGLYLPPNDRRHYVAWSDAVMADFDKQYWNDFYAWYKGGGRAHVVAYLSQPERLKDFDPKAPPPRTDAWQAIVDANLSPEDADVADALERMSGPDVATIEDLVTAAEDPGFKEWLRDRKNRRAVPHRLEACGYVLVRNPDATDGLWKIDGRRQALYGKRQLPSVERIKAARSRVIGPGFQLQAPTRKEADRVPF
jgi:hypothetical protein